MSLITNPIAEALKSGMSLQEFGKAMAQLDLTHVAPEKRHQAIMDHLARIMIDKIHDREKAAELATAWLMHRR